MKSFMIGLGAALAVCCISYATASPRYEPEATYINPAPLRSGGANLKHPRGFASDELTNTVFDRPTPLDEIWAGSARRE